MSLFYTFTCGSSYPDLRSWVRRALERVRMALAFRLIGDRPVLANVDIGGSSGSAVTAYGGRIWCNPAVRVTASPALQYGVIVHPVGVGRPEIGGEAATADAAGT